MTDHDQSPPPRIQPRVKGAPRVRQVYWADFPQDAQLPEFWKRRPVLIVSKRSRLYGNVTVLPMTTKSQPDNEMAYPVISPIDGERSWVICDYLTTIAVSRLSPAARHIPRIGEADFHEIIRRALQGLPNPRPGHSSGSA